jgi:hypothetical protein
MHAFASCAICIKPALAADWARTVSRLAQLGLRL